MRLPTTVLLFVILVLNMDPVESQSRFMLTVDPANVTRALTTNVTITCKPRDPQNRVGTYFNIFHRSVNGDGMFRELARIHKVLERAESAYGNVKVTGNLDNAGLRYLQIHWPVATADTFGTYKCFVGGLKPGEEQPSDYVLNERQISAQELLHYILKDDKPESTQHKVDLDRLRERLAGLEKSVQDLSAKVDKLAFRMENEGYAIIIP